MDFNGPRHCPILQKEIDVGLCMDIALQANGYFKPDALDCDPKIAKLSKQEIAHICDNCEHFPLHRPDSRGKWKHALSNFWRRVCGIVRAMTEKLR